MAVEEPDNHSRPNFSIVKAASRASTMLMCSIAAASFSSTDNTGGAR